MLTDKCLKFEVADSLVNLLRNHEKNQHGQANLHTVTKLYGT